MVEIQSKEVIDKMSDVLKVQPALLLPRELGKMIVPVFDVTPVPKDIVIKTATINNVTSGIIHTTHATKRTYLTGLILSVIKDINATSASSTISGFINGLATVLGALVSMTLTVQNDSVSITLKHPVELDKNTQITVTNSTAIGAIRTNGTAYFYETDPQ